MAINNVIITGNLTRDAGLRNTGTTPVLTFTVAVNDRYKNKQTDEWEDSPNFIDCVMFGARAKSIEFLMKKGVKVGVVGKLHQSTWEGKDGKRHSKIEVWASDIDFMQRFNNANVPTPDTNDGYYDDCPF